MSNARKIDWPNILAEGTAIVISILLAFWIDAWWEGRQQRYNETVLLQALLDDLTEKKNRLDYALKYCEAILLSATTLLNSSENADLTADRDEIDRLIGMVWWYNDPTIWESAPMSSLVVGGDLSNISNPKLLQQLSELQLVLSSLKNVYGNDQRFHNDVLIPFFIANINLPQVANVTKHTPGHPENEYVFPDFEDASPKDHSDLLSRSDFRSLLVAKIDKLVDLSDPHTALSDQLEKSIALIRDELAR